MGQRMLYLSVNTRSLAQPLFLRYRYHYIPNLDVLIKGVLPKTKKVNVGELLLLYNIQSYKRPSLYGNNDGKACWIRSVYQVLAQILDTEVPIPKDHNFQDNELSIVSYNHHSNTLVRTLGVLTIVGDPEAMFFGVDEENNNGLNIQIPTKFQIFRACT